MIVKFTQPNLSLFYCDSVLKKAPTQPAAFAVQAVSEHCLTYVPLITSSTKQKDRRTTAEEKWCFQLFSSVPWFMAAVHTHTHWVVAKEAGNEAAAGK